MLNLLFTMVCIVLIVLLISVTIATILSYNPIVWLIGLVAVAVAILITLVEPQ